MGTLIAVAAAVVAWFVIGLGVTLRAIPWGEIEVHATWSGKQLSADAPPRSSPWVGRLFWLCAAAVWPLAMRWHRLGYFRGTSSQPLLKVDETPPGA